MYDGGMDINIEQIGDVWVDDDGEYMHIRTIGGQVAYRKRVKDKHNPLVYWEEYRISQSVDK